MYREALATAAESRGWSVYWYDRERVFPDAAAVLGCEDIDAFLYAMGRSIGPPWQAKHKLAAAAAIAATGHPASAADRRITRLERTAEKRGRSAAPEPSARRINLCSTRSEG